MKKRLANLTIGRWFACMFTAFIMTMLINMAGVIFHMHLPAIVGVGAFLFLFASRLWRVTSTPPPQRSPSDLFPLG